MGTRRKAEKRRAAILDVIESCSVENQRVLVSLLKERHGISTTQAVVSRDLAYCGVVKGVINGKLVYEVPGEDVSKKILRLAITDITHNESMIVVKTLCGLADFVGDFLDAHNELSILGNISGENTIFVVPSSVGDIASTYRKICKTLYFKDML